MEYHFTGTGASPDFTFIADAIVDSVGVTVKSPGGWTPMG